MSTMGIEKSSNDPLGQFRSGKYLSIITYTKSGKEIATPVWFVATSDTVYIATPKITFKIRRLKKDPRVQIAPCSRDGKVLGSYVVGTAKIIPEGEQMAIFDQFRKKYGALFKIWSSDIKNFFRKKTRKEKRLAFVEITPKH